MHITCGALYAKRFDADGQGRDARPCGQRQRCVEGRKCNKMNKAQEKAVERLRLLVDKDCKDLAEEVKLFEVEEYNHFISVFVILGYENDEKTLAYVVRDYAHLFIGKCGGARYPVKSKSGNQYCKPFKWYSVLQAVCDQRHNYFH